MFSQATVLVILKLSSAVKVVLQHIRLQSEYHRELMVPTNVNLGLGDPINRIAYQLCSGWHAADMYN